MSEPSLSILISIVILVFLVLFVPCIESLVGLFRRNAGHREVADERTRDEDNPPEVA